MKEKVRRNIKPPRSILGYGISELRGNPKKIIVTDTNPLVNDSKAIDNLSDDNTNAVVIPWIVLSELDALKMDQDLSRHPRGRAAGGAGRPGGGGRQGARPRRGVAAAFDRRGRAHGGAPSGGDAGHVLHRQPGPCHEDAAEWLVLLTYAVGVYELVNVTIDTPSVYVVPAWIALVSVVLLVRRPAQPFAADAAAPRPT